jgi:predicted nucleic acid-binding protein
LRFYLDTSLLVSALTREAATQRMLDWIVAHLAEGLAVSWWVTTEFSAALSVKLRNNGIDLAGRADALLSYSELIRGDVTVLPLNGQHFRMAAQLADQYATGLRGSDALHLAVCADYGVELCTLDKRLASAGAVLGVKTLLL